MHLATLKPEPTVAQDAGWGPAAPAATKVRRLMRQQEIKEAVSRGAAPLQLYRVMAHNGPDRKARVSHMQLTAIKWADPQLQDRVQLYTQAAHHAPNDQRTYYNLLIH